MSSNDEGGKMISDNSTKGVTVDEWSKDGCFFVNCVDQDFGKSSFKYESICPEIAIAIENIFNDLGAIPVSLYAMGIIE